MDTETSGSVSSGMDSTMDTRWASLDVMLMQGVSQPLSMTSGESRHCGPLCFRHPVGIAGHVDRWGPIGSYTRRYKAVEYLRCGCRCGSANSAKRSCGNHQRKSHMCTDARTGRSTPSQRSCSNRTCATHPGIIRPWFRRERDGGVLNGRRGLGELDRGVQDFRPVR